MKSFIKKLLREAINEVEFNYHVGNLDDDLKNIKPYVSDNIIRMTSGRHTGHFGSGVYFSTYNCSDKRDYEKEYGNVDVDKKELTQFPKAYRVDFDIYKNLFRVKSNEHGEVLFNTLKLINQSFNLVVSHYDSKFEMDKDFGNLYLKIVHNAEKLGLKIPKYRDYIRMIQKVAEDMKNRTELASMSTRIMEYNGFNGVNVSGIPMFDNTLHGSVIYDLSKTSTKPIPVKDPELFCRVKYDVAGDSMDTKTRLLRGEKILHDDFLKLPKEQQIMVINRSKFYFQPYELKDFDNRLKRLYYNTLQKKIKDGVIEKAPSWEIINQMIEDGYLNMIYNKDIKFDDRTLLEITLDLLWRFDDDVQKEIVNNINRELTPDEEELLRMNTQ